MSKKFRFASLLQWRERQRDEAGAAVGQALEAIRRVDTQRDNLLQQATDVRANSVQIRLGDISVDRLLADGRFTMQIEIELRSLASTRVQLVEALNVRQEKLVLAEAEVKRFERLKELDRATAQKEELRRDQLSLDEAVTNRYLMRARSAALLRSHTE